MPTRVLESYVCCRCGEAKPREAYGTRKCENGRQYRLTRCKKCEVKRAAEKAIRHPLTTRANRDRHKRISYEKRKKERHAGIGVERFIVDDSKNADRKKGRRNDLTVAFVREAIANGCSYCDETELRMTMDRIDNDVGHVQANVIPACVRCNLLRRNMPYRAWMMIVPMIRAARESGAFGDWTGEIHRRRPMLVANAEDRVDDLLGAMADSI